MIIEQEFGDIGADDGAVLPQQQEEILPDEDVGSIVGEQMRTFGRFADLLLAEVDHLQLVSLSRNQRTYSSPPPPPPTKTGY